jgi:hypothetical protein
MICLCEDHLLERLSYDQLFSRSEPKRVLRARTVRGPPLDVNAKKDGVYYNFNFKAYPSTTGLRHKGYVKFFKPKKQTPLDKVECVLDCDCPDYKFRWAWVNKQKGSSAVGPKSYNQAWNRAPKITNPKGKVGLCKHLLALADFIYGEFENFDGDDMSTPEKLDAVVKSVNAKEAAKKAKEAEEKKAGKTPASAKKAEEPPAKRPAVIKPVGPTKSTGPKPISLPPEFNAQVQRRFGRAESVDSNVNAKSITNIIAEVEQIEANPEASEALELLREISGSLKILVGKEEAAPTDDQTGKEPSEADLAVPEVGEDEAEIETVEPVPA